MNSPGFSPLPLRKMPPKTRRISAKNCDIWSVLGGYLTDSAWHSRASFVFLRCGSSKEPNARFSRPVENFPCTKRDPLICSNSSPFFLGTPLGLSHLVILGLWARNAFAFHPLEGPLRSATATSIRRGGSMNPTLLSRPPSPRAGARHGLPHNDTLRTSVSYSSLYSLADQAGRRGGYFRGGRRQASDDSAPLGLQQVLQLVHELAHVFEIQIHRGEAHVGDFIEFPQPAHDQRADLRGGALALRRFRH